MLTMIRHKQLTDDRVAVVITGYDCAGRWRASFSVYTTSDNPKHGSNTLLDIDHSHSTEFAAIDEFLNFEA